MVRRKNDQAPIIVCKEEWYMMVRNQSFTILGPEGVLKHHVCHRWGFDSTLLQQETTSLESSMSGSDELMADDFGSNNEYIQTKAYLSEDLIEKMRNQLKKIIVPKGVTRLPSRIGTAQNGKLKANEWSVMFGVYLSLIVLDLFWD
ncbi:hypothetical protein O181_092227 [Austropuccinia psidii MF-1]|uniref:Uncharacterized protein n=1 Tax=Austropuccinia psidii MF-1 TaxID=1389203 RepID=A0A9Q3IZ27_9BASI|nr:hypothetical protein [Austropuccinia psidii MF-1]